MKTALISIALLGSVVNGQYSVARGGDCAPIGSACSSTLDCCGTVSPYGEKTVGVREDLLSGQAGNKRSILTALTFKRCGDKTAKYFTETIPAGYTVDPLGSDTKYEAGTAVGETVEWKFVCDAAYDPTKLGSSNLIVGLTGAILSCYYLI